MVPTTNISIVVPYTKGLSKRFKKTCNSLGIQAHFKSRVIYQFKCPHSNCQEEYIGESGRPFGDRLKEHLRALSPIHHHSHIKSHPFIEECLTIVGRESQVVTWTIKEAMYIHVNDPPLNRKLGKYQLPHIWDEILQDTPSLWLK